MSSLQIDRAEVTTFQRLIHSKGRQLLRPMPWRAQPSLYYVLVSELMLQQTQVSRVLPKFSQFVATFPDIKTLADSPLPDVLAAWQGLGYNRRAKYLWQAAQQIAASAPTNTKPELMALPGIGPGTAGAIMNYVHQVPTPFIETNIRTVYFNHFFADRHQVSDHELYQLVAATMDQQHPREWFWALMDYGTELKRQGRARLQTSQHYSKQTRFAGSVRQMRGEIIRRQSRGQSLVDIQTALAGDERFAAAWTSLERDGLLTVCPGQAKDGILKES